MMNAEIHDLFPLTVFKDKIVILGSSLAEEQDLKSVPLMKTEVGDFLMPGVDVHANAIQQLIHNSYISSSYNELDINSYNWAKHIGLIVFVVFITLLIVSNFKTFGSTISLGILLLLWFNYSLSEFTEDFFWFFNFYFINFIIFQFNNISYCKRRNFIHSIFAMNYPYVL